MDMKQPLESYGWGKSIKGEVGGRRRKEQLTDDECQTGSYLMENNDAI